MLDDAALAKIASLSGEYLFFIGATWLALLLAGRRRWIAALATFASGVGWITFHLPVSLYLASLGPDSFAESRGFNIDEARFWLNSLGEAVYPMFSIKKFSAYLVFSVLSFYVLRYLLKTQAGLSTRAWTTAKVSVAGASMVLAVHGTTAASLAAYLDNSELFAVTVKNFTNEAPRLAASPQAPDLVVYIGESTSAMNMGLYGYPRDTTPALARLAREEDGKLLVFHHVFSTHSHTSRSLLEALSFGLDPRQDFLPIEQRRRVSIVDVLNKAGLAPRLISNQGGGGAWDHTAAVIFKHSDNRVRTKQAAVPGAAPVPKWDDAYFAAELDRKPLHGRHKVTFLHSYAGHGPYRENIPERFRAPVDRAFAGLSAGQVLDTPTLSVDQVEAYDAAVRYVDHSVASVVERVRRSPKPTILVYFSDHGDAAFRGRGHDSARFSHEMTRVPLVMYFNEAARRAQPGLFEKYRALAADRQVATLAQLPSTVLDLLGIRAEGSALRTTPVFGERTPLPPIMIRQMGDSMTAINLNAQPLPALSPLGHRVVDRTDDETRQFVAIRSGRVRADELCAAQPPTFESMSRNILIAGCRYTRPLAGRGLP